VFSDGGLRRGHPRAKHIGIYAQVIQRVVHKTSAPPVGGDLSRIRGDKNYDKKKLRQDLQDEQDGVLVARIITFWRVSNSPKKFNFILSILFILSKSDASTA
jgi:hypothetical protein